jgi:hypothetical protein
MYRLAHLIAAEGVAFDQLTGRVTAFNMLDTIPVTDVPATLVRFAALASYELGSDPESILERVRVLDPEGKSVATSQSQISLAGRQSNQLPSMHRSFHFFWSLPLTILGDHRIVLEHASAATPDAWQNIAEQLITVVKQAHVVLNFAPTTAAVRSPSVEPPPSKPNA